MPATTTTTPASARALRASIEARAKPHRDAIAAAEKALVPYDRMLRDLQERCPHSSDPKFAFGESCPDCGKPGQGEGG